MIEFATILLGLVIGVQPIELEASSSVSSVEILLDGETLALLEAAPWRTEVDFGSNLSPHELVAVARDAEGREIGRARQFVNRPRQLAEATLVLEEEAGATVARLIWNATDFEAEPRLRVTFDGEEIVGAEPHRIPIPRHDPRQIHFLRAELEFSDTLQAEAELVLGGDYSGEVTAGLTAVILSGKGRVPPPEKMSSWLVRGESPLRVVAAERGNCDIYVVREESSVTLPVLDRLGELRSSASIRRLAEDSALDSADRLRFVLAAPKAAAGSQGIRYVFPITRNVSDMAGGRIYDLLTKFFVEDVEQKESRFLDAVAIAGVQAASGNRRRAVIVMVDATRSLSGRYSPSMLESYFEDLQVPVYVWSLVPPGEEGWAQGWSRIEDASSPGGLARAIGRMRRDLDRQFAVWVEGSYLPQSIEIAEAPPEIVIAP